MGDGHGGSLPTGRPFSMTTRQAIGPGGLRTWRPVRSSGVPFGLGLVGIAAICTVALVAADVATPSAPTRIVATVGAGIGLLVLITTAVGTWWCVSLRYALAPTALEVRWGERLLRIRHDEI